VCAMADKQLVLSEVLVDFAQGNRAH
jgi:hypothetical protein